MALDLTGKALLFKPIVYKEEESSWGFRTVPQNLSITQGIELLRKSESQLAQSESGPTPKP